MNEQLQDAVSEVLKKAIDGVDATTEFLQSEIPDYLYQLLLWYSVKNSLLAAVCTTIIIVIAVSYKKILSNILLPWYKRDKDNHNDTFDSCATIVSSSFIILLFFIPLLIDLIDYLLVAIQIWIAPKVWLIEYASSIIK